MSLFIFKSVLSNKHWGDILIEVAHIKIDDMICKACGICIAFCPKKVYVSKNGKPYPADADSCIRCRLCEIRCPDYAIEIGGEKK